MATYFVQIQLPEKAIYPTVEGVPNAEPVFMSQAVSPLVKANKKPLDSQAVTAK